MLTDSQATRMRTFEFMEILGHWGEGCRHPPQHIPKFHYCV